MADNIAQNRLFGVQTRKPRQRAASSLASASAPSKLQAIPTKEAIAKRAYEIWLSHGCESGHDVEHWLEAERQLKQQSAV